MNTISMYRKNKRSLTEVFPTEAKGDCVECSDF